VLFPQLKDIVEKIIKCEMETTQRRGGIGIEGGETNCK
jgi:hypothetical protein